MWVIGIPFEDLKASALTCTAAQASRFLALALA
jgi:hypothetical protein